MSLPRNDTSESRLPRSIGLPRDWYWPPGVRRSLLHKQALFVATIVVLTAGLLSWVVYVFARDTIQNHINQRLIVVAADRGELLETYASEQISRARLLTDRTYLRRVLRALAQGEIDQGELHETLKVTLRDSTRSVDGFLEMWIASPQGIVITATDDRYLNEDLSEVPEFRQGREQEQLGLPQLFDGLFVSYLSAPIRDEDNGSLLGVMMIMFDASHFVRLLEGRLGLGETGEVLVGTRVGDEIVYLQPMLEDRPARVPVNQVDPMNWAIEGDQGIAIDDYEGVEVLAAYRPVAYDPTGERAWGLVAKMNTTEAYEPVARLTRVLVVLQVSLLLGGLIASYWLALGMTRPILTLTDVAAAIAGGNMKARALIRSDDELGTLAASFNHMADELTKSYAELEQRVQERTYELEVSQSELERQRALLQLILDSMGDGVIVADQEGNFLLWNPAAEEIIGYGAMEIPLDQWTPTYGIFLSDAVTPCPTEMLPLVRAIYGEAVDSFELFVRNSANPEGSWISVTSRPLREAADGLQGGVVVIRDITEQRKAEEALQSSEEWARAIIDASLDAFVVIDRNGILLDWNPQAAAIFGWSAQEAIGQRISDLIVPEDMIRTYRREMLRYLETGQGELFGKRVELTALRRDGTEFPVEVTVFTPIRRGEAYIFSAFVRDITRRLQAEEEIKRYANELQRSNAELEQFAYVASHDLQEPLRAISGYCQLLQRRYAKQLDEKANEFIQEAVDGAQRMQALIDGMLDYSRLSRRGSTFTPVDCESIFAQALTNLQTAISEADAIITHDRLPVVQGDGTQLLQLFQNLIGNSLKYRSERRPEIHIGLQVRDDTWVFFVRDNGIGIDPKHADRVFDMFKRLHTRDEYEGTGIGLTLCQKIVERHGGRIWVESELGQGSTFFFTIPQENGDGDVPRS